MQPIRTIAIFLILIIGLPAVACNFPGLTPTPTGDQVSYEALRQTLAATGPTFSPAPPTTPADSTLTPTLLSANPEPKNGVYSYMVQSGDTPLAVAAHFGVPVEQLGLPDSQSLVAYLPPGETLIIPATLDKTTPGEPRLPDSELVNSPSAAGFNTTDFIQQSGGFLSTYQETVGDQVLSGAQVIQRVADELSVNPRLLLAVLEFRAGWVTGTPASSDIAHPIGLYIAGRSGLYEEIKITATQLNVGYYGWRLGTTTEIHFQDGGVRRLNPTLNAGSVALQHLFALLYAQADWQEALYGPGGFYASFVEMFGDPAMRAASVEPLLPAGLSQPELELPFRAGERWSFTAGPHPAWNAGTPRGALDFSPVTGGAVCDVSPAWATAAAPGVIVRNQDYAVALDLDGDGFEQTGWVLIYFHLVGTDGVPVGTSVNLDDPLGHPSCNGGTATGKHVHLARKYNGEWLPADGPLPFVLSGWTVHADERNYYGTLTRAGQLVTANPSGSQTSLIAR
jgi:LasA protease